MKKASFSSLSRPVRFSLYYFLLIVVLSFVGSLWITHEFWGYLLFRPGLLGSAKTITEVEHLLPVRTSDCERIKPCELVIDTQASLTDMLDSLQDPPHSPDAGRLLRHLQVIKQLPASFDTDLQGDIDLYAPMLQSPIIAMPDEGYANDFLWGVILIGKTVSGEKRAFISAEGGEVSNDHYPYYEATFTIGQNGKTVQYLDGQRFFFEVAGIEGFEGLEFILTIFGALALIFGGIPTTFVVIVDGLWRYYRSQ